MIRNIIFDIGNVLADFCWKDFFMGFGYEGEILEKLAASSRASRRCAVLAAVAAPAP